MQQNSFHDNVQVTPFDDFLNQCHYTVKILNIFVTDSRPLTHVHASLVNDPPLKTQGPIDDSNTAIGAKNIYESFAAKALFFLQINLYKEHD